MLKLLSICRQTQNVLFYVLKEKCLQTVLGLRGFIMLCNNVEYKNMDQDKSLVQLYDVQIEIKICYKQSGYQISSPLYHLVPQPNVKLQKSCPE